MGLKLATFWCASRPNIIQKARHFVQSTRRTGVPAESGSSQGSCRTFLLPLLSSLDSDSINLLCDDVNCKNALLINVKRHFQHRNEQSGVRGRAQEPESNNLAVVEVLLNRSSMVINSYTYYRALRNVHPTTAHTGGWRDYNTSVRVQNCRTTGQHPTTLAFQGHVTCS